MDFVAKALYIPYSPYKLRPIIDVVRGKPVVYALGWLRTHKSRRVLPIKKVIDSAVANAKDRKGLGAEDLVIRKACVDVGPVYRYFKPGAQGRSVALRRRLCHISVFLASKKKLVAEEE